MTTKPFDEIEDDSKKWTRFLGWRTKVELERAGFRVEDKK